MFAIPPYFPKPEPEKDKKPDEKNSENGAFTSSKSDVSSGAVMTDSGLFDVRELVREAGVVPKPDEDVIVLEPVAEDLPTAIPMPRSIPWNPGDKAITIFAPEDFDLKFTTPVELPKPKPALAVILDAQTVDDPKPTNRLKNSNELVEFIRDRGFVPADCDGKELQSVQGRWNMGILYDLDPTKKRRFFGLLRKKRDFIGYLEFGVPGNDREWKFTAYGNMSAALIADLENKFKVKIKVVERESNPRKEKF